MNTKAIKNYAPKARIAFINAVTQRLNTLGISSNRQGELQITPVQPQGSLLMIGNQSFDLTIAPARERLVQRCQQLGFVQLAEQVAYTWFNRLCAIRYMEVHQFLGHDLRVLSPANGQSWDEGRLPEIISHAQDAADELELDRNAIIELKLAGDKDEHLYRELLLGQCHQLHQAMPFLFEALDDETELLLPDNLTRTDSILRDLVNSIPEEDWQQVEVIGWLYQFYISEKKDEVIGKVVKSEDIPAATQLFTPNWIVKYMVQNSLGAQWLATYPESPLKEQMEYYIEPAEQTDEVNAQLKAITPESLNPEELTLIDPASGSGHILVEAYDLFKAIYLERGYRQRDIAQLILEKNLFGLDIDQRAAQLTGFALMMKGREDDRRLFERGVKLNVMAMVDSTRLDVDTLVHGIDLSQYVVTESATQHLTPEDLTALKDLFEHATTFGSLIQVPQTLAEKLPALKQLSETNSQDMFVKEVLEHLTPLVKQAEILAAQYDAVVANPPYMGGKYLTPILKKHLKDFYSGYEKDVFSAFIDRDLMFSKPYGRLGFMSPFVWMFISSYVDLRTRLIEQETISTLIQLEYSGFDGATVPICTFTLQKGHVKEQKGCYVRLSDFKGSVNQAPKTLEALKDRNCGWFFESAQDEFKKIPSSPLAYWLSNNLRDSFYKFPLVSNEASAVCGMTTGENARFVREWFEIEKSKFGANLSSSKEAAESKFKWFPYAKGGSYRKWYGNAENVVNWESDGESIISSGRAYPRARSRYFRPSVSWSFISSSYFGAREQPKGFIFDMAGCSLFPQKPEELPFYTALLCSKTATSFLKTVNPTLNFQVNNVGAIPVPNNIDKLQVESIAKNCVVLSEVDWNAYETSWDFQSFPTLSYRLELFTLLESSYNSWIAQNRDTIAEMKRLEEENNRLFIDAYSLHDELTPEVPIEQITLTVNPAYRYGIKGTEEERNTRFREDTMAELVSYAIGCMMGRYSLDEPGLIYANSGNEGFDDLVERGAYTKFPADDDGIIPLTDKEWFADDAANRLVEFISVAWPSESLEENLNFLAANLSPKKGEDSRDTIRRYLCDKFYKDHLQTYKKRPIYWLFSSGKQKAFQCLVYLHRYNESTLARMRTEYVTPLLGKYDAYAEQLEKQIETADSTSEANRFKKELDALVKKQVELREFDDKLKHYADMRISLDLDDGVKVNYGKFGDLLADVKGVTGAAPKA